MLAVVEFSVSDIVVGLLATGAVIWQGRKTRRKTKEELDTGNSHTAGQALARLEDMAWRHETRLDSVEVRLEEGKAVFDDIEQHAKVIDRRSARNSRTLGQIEETLELHVEEATERFDNAERSLEQHIYETRPLRNWVVEQIEKEGEQDG